MSKINIVQIQAALLVPLTAQFIINKLKVAPAETQKRLVLWNAADYALICSRLGEWIEKARQLDVTTFSGERPKKEEAPPAADAGGDFFGDDEGAPAADNEDFFG